MQDNNLRTFAREIKDSADKFGLSYDCYLALLYGMLQSVPKETAPDASTVQSNA